MLLIFCVQFTDLKIGPVKISEILLLAISPFVLLGKLNKHVVRFLLFFSVFAFVSLWITRSKTFVYLEPSFFKRPYWITIGRYIEIVSCLVLCNISWLYFKRLQKTGEFQIYLSRFINLNLLITLFLTFVYLLVIFEIISMDQTRFVYGWDTRLRGFFVEGGPYGLMLSFIFIIVGAQLHKRKIFIQRLFLFIVIFFMAKSKAGILCCVIWLMVENFSFIKNKLKRLLIPIAIICSIGFLFLFFNISRMYINEIERVKIAVKERPNDPNLVMGRISGFFIAPNMIKNNSLFGIGIGNYPLLRNNKEYRGFFPLPPKKIRNLDAHGYGGIMDIVVDTGILGFSVFIFILGRIFFEIKQDSKKIALLCGFVLLFIFGVQIHFMYPWVLLSLVLTKNANYETSGRFKINT